VFAEQSSIPSIPAVFLPVALPVNLDHPPTQRGPSAKRRAPGRPSPAGACLATGNCVTEGTAVLRPVAQSTKGHARQRAPSSRSEGELASSQTHVDTTQGRQAHFAEAAAGAEDGLAPVGKAAKGGLRCFQKGPGSRITARRAAQEKGHEVWWINTPPWRNPSGDTVPRTIHSDFQGIRQRHCVWCSARVVATAWTEVTPCSVAVSYGGEADGELIKIGSL